MGILISNLPAMSFKKNSGRIVLFFLLVISGFFSACVSHRNVEYLQDRNKQIREFKEAILDDYVLKPNDELYIQISSLDEASANIFSSMNGQNQYGAASLQPYSASLTSYAVDKDGFVLIPLIGHIFVKDKTTVQVSSMIRDSLSGILNQPIVTVKLVNRFVSVLGEVRVPGHFTLSQEKVTIFDALALAGDITEYGDRHEVILTRNLDGRNLRISIDLTKSSIMSSEYYYVRPNDMIYVKPLRKKFWGLKEFPFSIILSTISTALLIYTVITK